MQIVEKVSTAIPVSFVQQLLQPLSPIMKLRFSTDQAVSVLYHNYASNLVVDLVVLYCSVVQNGNLYKVNISSANNKQR